MKSQKLTNLIRELSDDLPNPSETHRWTGRFWVSWGACFFLTAFVTWYTTYRWPYRSSLPTDLNHPLFWVESFCWISAALLSAVVTYQSSFPVWPKNRVKSAAFALIASLFIYTLFKGNPGSFSTEFGGDRGDCGLFIFLFGSLSAVWMIFVIRKAAPTNLVQTGAWAAASTGCIGATFMHLVCREETTAHLVVWHFAPIAVLAGMSGIAARKVLSW